MIHTWMSEILLLSLTYREEHYGEAYNTFTAVRSAFISTITIYFRTREGCYDYVLERKH